MKEYKVFTLEDKLVLYFITHHPVAFRDFFLPKVLSKYYKTRFYQFLEALSDESVVVGGRGWGKSLSLEATLLQRIITEFNKESLLSSFRKVHIRDRLEAVISYLWIHPFFRAFLIRPNSLRETVSRTPIYEIKLKNGHKLWGISVGDDPLAIMIQGKHPQFKYIEEAGAYPQFAWIKWQGTADPTGCKEKVYGVADGRRDTPYYQMVHKLSQFKNKVFKISKRLEPHYDSEKLRNDIEVYRGEETTEFRGEVDAEWGESVRGAWSEQEIINCFDQVQLKNYPGVLKNRLKIITIDSKDYEGMVPETALGPDLLPFPEERERVLLGVDTGFVSPTTILPFFYLKGKWYLTEIIKLTNRMITDDQAELLDFIMEFYNVDFAGLDTTSNSALATALQNPKGKFNGKNYKERIVWVQFNKTMASGYEERDGKIKLRTRTVRDETSAILRWFFSQRKFNLFYSEEILTEFGSERRKLLQNRETIVTPDYIHITDAFRCFAYVWRTQIKPVEKPKPRGRRSYKMVTPKFGKTRFNLFGRGNV